MDTLAYFSYNPAGIFSQDNKGSISGASDYSGNSKANRENDKITDAQKAADAAAQAGGSGIAEEGVITDAQAQELAKKRLFRTGSVYTTALGDEITADQLAGTRLR